MAWNTKNWQTRLREVKNTIQTKIGHDVAYKADLLKRIDVALGKMRPEDQRTLSNSLHLKKQKSKSVRDLIRVHILLERLLMDNPRTVDKIIEEYINQAEYRILSDLKRIIKNLDPDYHPPDLARHRPLLLGCSISGGKHPGPGTIGLFVKCKATGKIMILGNEHVMKAEFGTATVDAPDIFQPSIGNGANQNDKVALYDRGVLDTRIDAAVAYLKEGIEWANRTPEGVAVAGICTTYLKDDHVWKRGTASRRTEGRINDVNAAKSVPHGRFDVKPIEFAGQIEVKAFNGEFQIPGDSGSSLWNEHNQIIGLMHGGGKDGGGIAAPIQRVFDILNVELP